MPKIDEHAAVTALVRRMISADKFPFSPRPLKAALAKLDPPPKPMPPPLPAGPMGSSRREARR